MCSPACGIKAGYAAGNIFVFAANSQVEQEWSMDGHAARQATGREGMEVHYET